MDCILCFLIQQLTSFPFLFTITSNRVCPYFGFKTILFSIGYSFPVSTFVWSASRGGDPQINRQVTPSTSPLEGFPCMPTLIIFCVFLYYRVLILVDNRNRVHLSGVWIAGAYESRGRWWKRERVHVNESLSPNDMEGTIAIYGKINGWGHGNGINWIIIFV